MSREDWLRSPEDYHNTESGPVVLLGNGPSLKDWNLSRLECPTIGTNRSYKIHPSKCLCFVTSKLMSEVMRGQCFNKVKTIFCPEFLLYSPRWYSDPKHSCWDNVRHWWVPLVGDWAPMFGYDLTKPIQLQFAGQLAIAVALWLGFTEVYLIGYDGHGGHFNDLDPTHDISDAQRPALEAAAAWADTSPIVNIYQTNPESAFQCFPLGRPPMTASSRR